VAKKEYSSDVKSIPQTNEREQAFGKEKRIADL
jgi:hypothetical protein